VLEKQEAEKFGVLNNDLRGDFVIKDKVVDYIEYFEQ
jgi:hypothetical protein